MPDKHDKEIGTSIQFQCEQCRRAQHPEGGATAPNQNAFDGSSLQTSQCQDEAQSEDFKLATEHFSFIVSKMLDQEFKKLIDWPDLSD